LRTGPHPNPGIPEQYTVTTAPDITAIPASLAPDHRALTTPGIAIRIIELGALFIGMPALIWVRIVPVWMFWGILGAAAAYVCVVLTLDRSFRWRTMFRWSGVRPEIGRILGIWAIALAAMVAFTWSVDRHIMPLDTRQPHALLFTFPTRAPSFWAAVMVLYPIFSVLPQELIFRVFFFHRYERMLGGTAPTIIASALAFGWAHILFENWIAVALSGVLGLLLGVTFARSRSGGAAWIEHALYGNAAFTIGLGWFFFTGSVPA